MDLFYQLPQNTNAETLTNVEPEISSKYVVDKNIIKTIESLKSGMEGINDYIFSEKLKFKIIEKDNNNEIRNTYQSENINNKRQPRAAVTLDKIV